jgi:glutaminyl-peptide cyclotransferase
MIRSCCLFPCRMDSKAAPAGMKRGRMTRDIRLGRMVQALIAVLFLVGGAAATARDTQGHLAFVEVRNPAGQAVPVLGVTVVKSYPHDPHAFTQGLEYFDGSLYESTGRSGQSTLRQTVLETGAVLKQVSLPTQYFGEGLTIFHGKVYQLTWLTKIGFVYDVRSFRQVGEFHYGTEGWGLTHDDSSLILSDGTNKLLFLDPVSFKVTRTLEVYAGNEAVTNLNELEYIRGEIFANVWHSARIARIDPRSGQVLAWIDLTTVTGREKHGAEDVLNGIAYDAKRGRLLVTGKDWAAVYEIKVEGLPREP